MHQYRHESLSPIHIRLYKPSYNIIQLQFQCTHTHTLKVKDTPSGGGGGLPGQRTTDYAELDTPAPRLSSVVPAPSSGAANTVSKAKFDIVKEQLKKAQVVK